MTDLERRLKKAKDATADAGASSEHSETDLERRLRIAHEEKKQYTRSGEYRRNALQNRTESFMDIVTQGETEARAGIDRYKANRDADYYQQMNKAGVTFRDQDMINRSVTGYKGAYDLWKSAFDREKDAAADRTRREREMTENPAKAPTVSDIVSRYSGKTKTLADLGNNVRGAIDAYKRQSDAAKAAPTPEEARQQAEESVQYWQNVAREAARYGDVYRQATAKKHLAESVENYSRATKGYFDNLKNTDPGTYYALTMTPEEIDRELELLNNGAYLDSKITNSLTNDERIMGEYWHRTPQEQRQYEHNLERARFAGETDDERNAYISSEKEAYRDARNRMLNDASVEGSVGSNQEPYNRREEITQANEARKSVLENARLTQKVIQADREGITNDPQIIASGKQKFEKDQQEIWNNSTVQPGWTPGSSAQTSLDLYQHNYSSAYENGYVLDSMTRLTDEQRNKVYALYERDPQTALKLAQTYVKALDDKVYQEIFDWVAKDSGWQFGRRAVGNLAGAVMNLASGLDPFGYGGQSAGKVGDALIGGAAQSATRNGWFGIEELGGDRSPISSSVPFVGRGRAGEASQLVSSMEQSALTTLPALVAGRYDAAAASWLETAGLLLQSSSAARSDYRESIEAGLDDTTAKIHAVAAGIAEYTFEKVSFDKLLAQNTSRMTFKKAMKDVLVQAGIEGSEELHTTLANTIMDEIISGDGKSKIDRRIAELVQGGMSMKEAKGVAEKEWLTGIVNDFIGGAASGGIMTGAHYAVGATVNTAENKIANNAVNQLVGQYAGAQTENFTDADTIEAAKNYAEARGIDASGLTEAAARARDASVDEAMSALRGSTQSESETEKLSKRDSRKAGKAWTEIRTQISQDFDGKSGAQAAQLYDQMAEQYGAGIKTIVDEVVTTQARQSYLEQSQTAQELQQKVKPQVEALPEGGYKQASMRAYDQAEYQLRQQEAAKTADRLAKAGNIDTEVTYTNKDGSETTAQIADLSDDLTSVVLDNGETVPIKDVQMSADTASAIRIFSRIAGKKAASLAFREYRAYLNNGGTEGYRFAEAVATAYGQGLNGVLTPEQALKMAPDFAQEAAERAFNAGRQKHQANIENEQARRKAAEEKAKAEGAQTVKGELRGEGSIKWEKMNATRRTRAQNQIKYLDSIAQGIGVDIELFQSEATRRGKRMAYRGEQGAWYVDKATGKPVIRIDVNAGANFISDLNAALIATTGHELAHHFQHISPAVYDEYRQAVVQAILSTENGYEKLQRLIEHEKRINRRADGTTISTDEAIDEVVADASRDRVGDRNLWKNVADSMSDESRGKVAQWLHDRFSKILKLTKRYAGFEAADLVLQSAQEYQDLIGELWEKLATQAATAVDVRSEDYTKDPDAASNNPSSTAFAMRFNPQITEGSMNFRKRHPALSKHISNEVLQAANESVEKMVSIMLPYLDGPQVTNGKKYLPDEVLGTTTFKDSSYGGKSIENTTICWRTLAYIEFTDEIKKKIGRPLTVQESFLASQMLYDIAKEPQCLYCYVSLDRKAYDGFLLDYLKQRDSVIESYAKLSQAERDEITKQTRNPNPGKKNKTAQDAAEKRFAAIPLYKEFLGTRANTGPMRARFAQWIDIANSGSKLVSSEDLATAERRGMLANGMSWADGSKLAKQTVSLADQVNDAAQYAQSASWAKKMEEYRAYNGDILKMSAKTVAKLNGEYGLRFYSFSEYTPAFIVENMQQIRDASLKGLRGLAYTKKTDFARIFWQTGMNINISVFGRWGTDASGKRTVLMDKDQGADWNEVKALRDHENVGAVFVATDDEMVDWALAQDWIDVVIPFHTVRTGADVAAFYDWVVHNKEQADINEKGNNKTVTAAEHGNDRDTFLQICKERGLTPRFSKWLNNPNYMKLVNETRQPVSTSMPMSPIYDTEAAENSFRSFIEDGGYYGDYYKPVDVQQAEGKTGLTKDEAIDRVVNDIREGRNAKQVDYGRQDYELVEDEFGRIRVNNRTHGQNIKRYAARSVEETDAEYLELAKDPEKNKARLQEMVDEAAEQAGYTKVGDYYIKNSAVPGNTSITKRQQHFFELGRQFQEQYEAGKSVEDILHMLDDTDLENMANQESGSWERFFRAGLYGDTPKYRLAIRFGNIPDGKRSINWANHTYERGVSSVNWLDENTQNEKTLYDAIYGIQGIEKQIIGGWDFGIYGSDGEPLVVAPEKIADDAERSTIKLAKVTYDDDGNVIPLSERFNPENNDIRYSERDTEYMDAVDRGDMETAQRMVEEAAKAAGFDSPKLYHGSGSFGFTKIDTTKSDDGISFFATNNIYTASTYSGSASVTEIGKTKRPEMSLGDYRKQLESQGYDSTGFITDKKDRSFFLDSRRFEMSDIDRKQIEEGKEGAYGLKSISGMKDYLKFMPFESGFSAKDYSDKNSTYGLFANTDNFAIVDGKGNEWNRISSEFGGSTRTIAKNAKEAGYSGVIIKNVYDTGYNWDSAVDAEDVDLASDIYIFFDPQSQIKSADPVTYDDDGNVIPLSERFNPKNDDIRYAQRDYGQVSDLDVVESLDEKKATTPEAKALIREAKEKAEKIRKLEQKLSELRGELKTTDRALNTRGITKLSSDMLKRMSMSNDYYENLSGWLSGKITEVYQNALDQMDRTGSVRAAGDALYNGAQEIADFLMQNAGYHENIGGKWQRARWASQFAQNEEQRQAVMNDVFASLIRDWSENRNRAPMHETEADRIAQRATRPVQKKLDETRAKLETARAENAEMAEKNASLTRDYESSRDYAGNLLEYAKSLREQLNDAEKAVKLAGKTTQKQEQKIADLKRKLHDALQAKKAMENATGERTASRLQRQLEAQIEREQRIMEGKLKPLAIQRMLAEARDTATAKARAQAQERFANQKENRKRGELRARIINLADEIQRTATRPTESKYVPASLYGAMSETLGMVSDLLESDNTKGAAKRLNIGQKILELKNEYEKIKSLDDAAIKSEYDEDISMHLGEIETVLRRVGLEPGKSYHGMTLRDLPTQTLQDLYDEISAIYKSMRDARKALAGGRAVDISTIQNSIIEQQAGIDSLNEIGKIGKLARNSMLDGLSTMRAVEMMSGWNRNAALYKTVSRIEDGAAEAARWSMNYNKRMQPLKTGKNELTYRNALTKRLDWQNAKDMNSGKPVKMTKLQALQIYMSWLREESDPRVQHLHEGGTATIRDARDVLAGKASRAASNDIRVTPELMQEIKQSLTEWDQQYMDAIHEYMTEEGEATNKIHYQVKHKVLKTSENYFPEMVNKDYVDAKLEETAADNLWVMAPGATNELRPGAKQPVIIDGTETVMAAHVRDMANYIGLALPIRDFAKVLNGKVATGEAYATTIRSSISPNFGQKGIDVLKHAAMDVQGGRKVERKTQIERYLNGLHGAFVRSTLLINPSVTIKQAASYAAIESILSYRAVVAGNRPIFSGSDNSHSTSLIAQIFMAPDSKTAQRLYDEIDEHTALHYQRRQGMSYEELAHEALRQSGWKTTKANIGARMEQNAVGRIVRKTGARLSPVQWIQRMDVATTAAIWVACKTQSKIDGFEAGTQEFWNHTTQLYERCLRETQPMYDPLHRSERQKGGGLMQYLFPFRTVPFQNHGQIVASFEAMKAAKGTSRAKEATRFFRKTVVAQVKSAIVFSVLSMLAAGLRHKPDEYMDENGEVDLGAMLGKLGIDTASTLFSVIFPLTGSETWEFGESQVNKFLGKDGKQWDIFSVGAVEMLNDMFKAAGNVVGDAAKAMQGEKVTKDSFKNHVTKLLLETSAVLGIPLENIKKYGEGIVKDVGEILDGKIPAFNNDAIERDTATNIDRYLKAWSAGDEKKRNAVLDELRGNLAASGKDEKEVNQAIRTAMNKEVKTKVVGGSWTPEKAAEFLRGTGAYSDNQINSTLVDWIKTRFEQGKLTEAEAIEAIMPYTPKKNDAERWDTVRGWAARLEHEDDEEYAWKKYEELTAAVEGREEIGGILDEYRAHGYTDKQLNDAVKGGIRAALTGGSITENEAIDLLTRYVTYTKDGQAVAFDKDKAWKTVQEWQAKAENDGDPDYSYNQYDELFSAIDANKDVNGIVSELTAHGYDKDDVTKAVKGHLIDNYVAGKASETALKNQLSRYCRIVKTDEVSEIVNSANCKKATGYYPDSLKDGYVDGKLSKDNVISALKVYKGLDSTSASNRVRAWDFQKENPDLKWDSDRVDAYYDKRPEGGGKSAYEAGISVETYDDYRNRAAKAKGVDANGDGRTDSGSKKAEILRIIDSLDLSRSQKDALYYINGWAASTIYEAPWH